MTIINNFIELGSIDDRETSPTSAAATEIPADQPQLSETSAAERESPQVTFDDATNTEPPLSSDRPENESDFSKHATTEESDSESKPGGGRKRKKDKKGAKKGKKKKKGKGMVYCLPIADKIM